MNRTWKQRLDAHEGAIAEGKALQDRIKSATDAASAADLMAEAIEMDRRARGLEVVRRDGLVVLSMERLQACYCLDQSREAYLSKKASAP